jgi:diguanylate cyclase (GGDEF)-like protein/PAS domain S-box-containing protein
VSAKGTQAEGDAYLRTMIDASVDLIVATDRDGRVTQFNRAAQRKLGYSKEEITGQPAQRLFARKKDYHRLLNILRAKGVVRNYGTTLEGKGSEKLPVSVTVAKLKLPGGHRAVGTVCIARDIRKQQRLENDLRERTAYLETLLTYSQTIIIVTDAPGRILEFNKTAEQILGYRREEILGTPAEALYQVSKERHQLVRLAQKKGSVTDYETTLTAKDGHPVEVSVNFSVLRDKEGAFLGTVGFSRDISHRKKLEHRLQQMTITDELTGLYNRRHFFSQVPRELARCHRKGRPLALIFFDIDRFKEYNDRCGHLAGDALLQRIGHLVPSVLRPRGDLPYRYGGDEFVLVLPGADTAQAVLIADRLRRRFRRTTDPEVSLSLGIAQHQGIETIEKLLGRADRAMYAAKAKGRNRIETF